MGESLKWFNGSCPATRYDIYERNKGAILELRNQTCSVGAGVLLLVEKSDSARIEAVIATDYLYLSGINFGLENRRLRLQA